MPKVSVNILTKNRKSFLEKAVLSVLEQTLKDWELIIVDDGSSDSTVDYLQKLMECFPEKVKIISHTKSLGITQSRQEALYLSKGEYIAILDDDDEWINNEKLSKQVKFFERHPEYVLIGGGIVLNQNSKFKIQKYRPESERMIRNTMLFRNNFFTSTVMFKKETAIKAGGFIKDEDDFAEDYDLWLRMGKFGKMRNYREALAAYRVSNYNKEKYIAFLKKQIRLINKNKGSYPFFLPAKLVLGLKVKFSGVN